MGQLGRTKIALGAAGIILAVFAILFRASIGSIFDFGSGGDTGSGVEETLGGLAIPSGAKPEQTSPLSVPKPQAASASPTGPFPAYRGRDPGEIRPDPKAVAGLSDQMREEVYKEIKIFAQTIKEQPTFGQAWLQIGIFKKSIGDYEGAADAWEYASIIRPESFIPPANLAEVYWNYLPDYPRAEQQFREAIRRDPNQQSLYIKAADFYSYAYREKEHLAGDILREGLGAIPGNVDLIKALGAVYERRGEYRSAIEWWERALELQPNDSAIQEKINELRAKL